MGSDVTMQDVLRRFYPHYLDDYDPSPQQAKAVYHILNCKTGAFGTNISCCGTCEAVSCLGVSLWQALEH